ncbi:hypothetical protein JCGZ_18595 [Jatropha curcas]|uniref:Uncharacterized protein n=1 Tax=Jatropha curcas TaxID=180498 RepID=A0A067K4N7_JATCU|nr:hypothetical protein JCGZ_08856 [Jatropha curcas]KDP30023.1 hypothetical protein JCGZ_18595 [Jatropha curcas]
MSKVAEVMKKKSGTDSSEKGRPVVTIDSLVPQPETTQKSPNGQLTPLSPPVAPSRKRQREEDGPSREMARYYLFAIDVRYFDSMDNLARKDFINQLFQPFNANNFNFGRITNLKGGYIKMEVKKNEMAEALKSLDAVMSKQETQHKAKIIARDVELERLKEENSALLWKNKDLESKNEDMKEELQELRDQEGSMAEDLVKACLSLRVNILSELKTQNPGEDWSWVNKIYPNDDNEEEDVPALGDSEVGDLLSAIEVHQEILAQDSTTNLNADQ